jgi:DNA-binding NarL/FixJ family response regulator
MERDHVIEWFARMPDVYRRLRAIESVGALFARASAIAIDSGFDHACVVTIANGSLTADGSEALEDPASDRLRRRIQAAPIALAPGTLESELIRGVRGGRRGRRRSLLADALELEHYEIAVVAPDAQPVALLLVDRAGPAVDASIAGTIGLAFEHVVLHARVAEVSAELRQMAMSTQALMSEVLQAPLAVPEAGRNGYTFPAVGPAARGGTAELLTEREEQIALLLVEGRSNREIGERLMLSPETVKDYVARLRRKLQAANRVEAASRYLQMVQAG